MRGSDFIEGFEDAKGFAHIMRWPREHVRISSTRRCSSSAWSVAVTVETDGDRDRRPLPNGAPVEGWELRDERAVFGGGDAVERRDGLLGSRDERRELRACGGAEAWGLTKLIVSPGRASWHYHTRGGRLHAQPTARMRQARGRQRDPPATRWPPTGPPPGFEDREAGDP